MIAREVSLLQKELTQQRAHIYEKEINYIYRELSTISASASILGGFVYNSINLQGAAQQKDAPAGVLHCVASAITLVLNILAVVSSTFLSVWGPNVALRGSDSAMRSAVLTLRRERRFTLELFVGGIFFFFLSTASTAWLYWDVIAATITTLLMAAGIASSVLMYVRSLLAMTY